jgi:hypothetical protein
LHNHRHRIEEHELDVLEEHHRFRVRELELAEAKGGVRRVELVVEDDGQTEEQHARPKEPDAPQHAASTAQDARLDGVHDGDVPEKKGAINPGV